MFGLLILLPGHVLPQIIGIFLGLIREFFFLIKDGEKD